jgi:beta-glucosidase
MNRLGIMLLLFLTMGLVFPGPLWSSSAPQAGAPLLEIDGRQKAKIEALMKAMTLEEKIGQLTLFSSDCDVTGATLRTGYKEDIQKGRVGAIFNAYSARLTRQLQEMAVKETRLGIPMLFGYDVIHGMRTTFPIPLAEACSWDLDVIERDAHCAAAEAAAEGIHWTFAPMVDIARDPRWGRIAEGAGEDTFMGTQVARARVRGFQGKDLTATDSVLACAKHYAAYGVAQGGRDYNTTDLSTRELLTTYLPPFKAAVDEGAATIMTAFNDLNGVPCTGNSYLLDDILRKKWGFRGFVVTDYTSINEMICHGIVGNEKDAGELAINAGVDMDMQGAVYMNNMAALVREGKVSMATIDAAVRRILEMKARKGLFDDPYRYSDEAREKETIMNARFIESARDAARKSAVLLKNDHKVLPLAKNVKTIALIGPLADDRRNLTGCWGGAAEWKKAVTVREGITAKLPPTMQLLYAKGCEIEGDEKSGFDEAVDAAKKSDVIIACMGEKEDMSGEASSRSEIGLPGEQRDLLKKLKKTGKPVILVLMNGRPLTVPWEAEHMDAILEAWFLGTETGNALADIIFGDFNPCGKLTVTFPRSVGQIPLYYNMKNTGRPLDPKNRYTSRYLDMPNSPLFPFGYGLSYTTFDYSPLTLDKKTMGLNDSLTVTVTVKNTGNCSGDEIVQLYIRDLVSSATRPVKELKAFRKVSIPAGESKTVTFNLAPSDLAFYRRDMSYGVEAGEFKVYCGTNSSETKEASFTLTQSGAIPEP